MSFAGFVDVAIGLVLMYLVLSLMCTTLNELIATALKLRAQLLSKTITQIIDDADVRKAFYNNGIIANAKSASRGGDPAPGDISSDPASGRKQETDLAGKPRDREHPSYFDSNNFAMALLDSLDPNAQNDPKSQKSFPSIPEIEELVAKMNDSDIRDVLLANIATAKGSLETLRNNLATWFDTAMDRLSGDYKRLSKRISIAVGILLAIALNADSLKVGTKLWSDDALRSQLVSAAADVLKAPNAAAGTACESKNIAEQTSCLARQWSDQEARLRPFPIGWHTEQFPSRLDWFSWLVAKSFGLLWTGLALSFGAPFWFDFLQKFMNVRGTGPNPSEKKTKAAVG